MPPSEKPKGETHGMDATDLWVSCNSIAAVDTARSSRAAERPRGVHLVLRLKMHVSAF
jgi:hypothetical protein